MKIASKNDILQFSKRRYSFVEIPEIDLKVRIQSLTEREKSRYETDLLSKSGRGVSRTRLMDASRRLVAICAVDNKGERLFTDDNVSTLADIDALVITRIAKECEVHIGMSEGDGIAELVKNSETATLAEDSPSD